jgi:ribose transport system substrate-binding protein
MKKLIAIVLSLMMAISMIGCSSKTEKEPTTPQTTVEEPTKPSTSEEQTEEPKGNPNKADFDYIAEFGDTFDINKYYNDLGVDCDVSIRSAGGVANVPDVPTTDMPKAARKYKIGFSVYYTVDEVGAMLLDTMKEYAEKCGVELLVNDANYDQNAQNQAVEQWILEGIDGAIIAPCDFTGVKGALDALNEAGIKVITLNPPLAGEVDSIVMSECTEQGRMAGELLLNHLLDNNVEMKGTIVFQSLPFVHPNAATRADGFKSVFANYPDVKIVELSGVSPEEHYTAFEGALLAYPDMIGAFGLYSAATVGMMNAKKANNSNVPLTSIDNDKPILQGIYEGDVLGSCCYSSTAPAIWCMSQLVNLLNGEEIPSTMFYSNKVVTKDNVEEMFPYYYNGKTLADYMSGATN